MDRIVFDIETKNSFADVGGRQNLAQLDVSVVGVYSYDRDEYAVYCENELDELGEELKRAGELVGFSSKSFDVPILEKYFNFSLSSVPHFDIFEEIYKKLGRRIGLGPLAEANLGEGKTAKGMEAIDMYSRGDMQMLKEYCTQDVKVTKGLFDTIRSRGYLWVPRRNMPQMEKVEISYTEPEVQQGTFL